MKSNPNFSIAYSNRIPATKPHSSTILSEWTVLASENCKWSIRIKSEIICCCRFEYIAKSISESKCSIKVKVAILPQTNPEQSFKRNDFVGASEFDPFIETDVRIGWVVALDVQEATRVSIKSFGDSQLNKLSCSLRR